MRNSIFILLISTLFANEITDISKNINQNQAKLAQTLDKKSKISSKLDLLGSSINKKLNQINQIDTQILNLNDNIKTNQNESKNQSEKLKELQNNLLNLDKKLSKIGMQLSDILLRYMTYSDVIDSMNNEEISNMDDVILKNTFQLIKKDSLKNMQNLQKQQDIISRQISNTNNNINKITNLIQSQQDKQKTLIELKKQQNDLLSNMQQEIASYNNQLKRIDKERQSLDGLLKNLNILKKNKQEEIRIKEEKERLARLEQQRQEKAKADRLAKEKAEKMRLAKLEEEKRKAELEAKKIQKSDPKKAQELVEKANKDLKNEKDTQNLSIYKDTRAIDAPLDVKQVATSYQESKTISYRGKKTIPPLKSYTLEQAFGPYYDPVYKLKVFNDSIILKSKEKDALVYNIMDGKVVYAKEMPMLKKVVIIEHKDALFTIYSQLDKISPLLKQGNNIKSGAVIGRVSERLYFEITQSDKHINPIEVIDKSK